MPALRRGDATSKDNLNIFVYNQQGSLKDPYDIKFSIYDMSCGVETLIAPADRIPIKFTVGSFYAPWKVPEEQGIGKHKIVWTIQESAVSGTITSVEEFDIVSRLTIIDEDYPEPIKRLIKKLRIRLRDINPDRDYHFAPPEGENKIAGFTETRGYRWEDEQLVNHLEDAANYVNLIPPGTDYELISYPRAWEPLLLMEAQVYALYDLSILWAGEEFNYSLGGISLDIQRSDKYSNLASRLQDMVDKRIEVAKKRILVTMGLRQSRYTYSRGAAMGPWTSGNSIRNWVGERSRVFIG